LKVYRTETINKFDGATWIRRTYEFDGVASRLSRVPDNPDVLQVAQGELIRGVLNVVCK